METYCDPQHVVMDENATMNWPTIVQRLLQCIEHEAGMGCSADPPTNDIADVNIDHERHVDEPVPGRHVGKIRDPKPIRGWRVELAVDVIQRTRCRLIADRGAHRLDPMKLTVIVDKRDHRLNGRQGFGLAPPAQNMRSPCAESRWPGAAPDARVRDP